MDIFFIENDGLFRKTILFGIKSALTQKNNLIVSLSTINKKKKKKSHGDKVSDFHDKKIAKKDSNHTCLAAISLGSALKKDENYYLQVFLKECKYIKK